jgi:hypothetical protein
MGSRYRKDGNPDRRYNETPEQAAAGGCAAVIAVVVVLGGLVSEKCGKGAHDADPKVTEVREPASPPPTPSAPVHAAGTVTPTSCGRPGVVVPKPITASEWSSFSCMAKEEAGAVWSRCLPGSVYSTRSEQACPGDKRCCPAR